MSGTTKNEGFLEQEIGIQGQYKNWFLDYASYVILERAVPAVEDGLKPVQRRILHAMKEMDDGRFNKVANIIGQAVVKTSAKSLRKFGIMIRETGVPF